MAAVYRNLGAVDVSSVLACEQSHGSRDIAGFGDPTERDTPLEVLTPTSLSKPLAVDVRVDGTGKTALHVIPYGPSTTASARMRPSTPALLAQ